MPDRRGLEAVHVSALREQGRGPRGEPGPTASGVRGPLAPGDRDAGTPRQRILHVFERLEKASTEPAYHGCPYLAALVELKDPEHPASVVARGAKEWMRDFLRARAQEGGARDPELLARQLMLVFDGASARAGAQVETLDGLATATVTALLDAAGVE